MLNCWPKKMKMFMIVDVTTQRKITWTPIFIACLITSRFSSFLFELHTHTLYTRKDKTSKHQYYNCYVYWNVIKVVKANFLMEISNGTPYIYVLDMNDLYLCVHILDEILLLLLYCYSTQVNPYTQPFIWEKFYCISNSKCTYDDDDDDAASTRHNTF